MMASRQHGFTRIERGFTLIELVVVITILGILAAFAVPKFINVSTQARIASLNGLAGSIKSAASLARGLAMVSGVGGTGLSGTVTMEGATVLLYNYYPDSTAGAITNAVNASADYAYTVGVSGAAGIYTLSAAPAPATCIVTYTPATAASPPTVVTTTGGC